MEKESFAKTTTGNVEDSETLIRFSQQFLLAARTGKATEPFVEKLQNLKTSEMDLLQTDEEKKAFWMNAYNAFTQQFLKRDPWLYKKRHRFFTTKQITIAGQQLSLDDVEHGILRRSKNKWGLGYLGKLVVSRAEKKWRVETLDHRIHFALNCGSKSCPPIAFYNAARLDQQLDLATRSFLESEVEIRNNAVWLPAILRWFRGDFGGMKGIRRLLCNNGFAAINDSTKLRFKRYNWQLLLENFR